MANREVFRYLKDSTGNELNAFARTTTFQSETINAGDYEEIGFVLDVNTVAGTTPSVTPSLQLSYDGGTTWLTGLGIVGAVNTTAVSNFLDAFTQAGEEMVVLENYFPETGKGSLAPRYRVNFAFTANTTSWTTNVWLILRDRTKK